MLLRSPRLCGSPVNRCPINALGDVLDACLVSTPDENATKRPSITFSRIQSYTCLQTRLKLGDTEKKSPKFSIKAAGRRYLTFSSYLQLHHSPLHSLRAMIVTAALSFALAATVSLPARAAECITPSVRREWRQFSKDEKADWISAVNVRRSLSSAHVSHPDL